MEGKWQKRFEKIIEKKAKEGKMAKEVYKTFLI